MAKPDRKQKVVIVGAGPVGCLAAIYAASRGDDVELYELRGGKSFLFTSSSTIFSLNSFLSSFHFAISFPFIPLHYSLFIPA